MIKPMLFALSLVAAPLGALAQDVSVGAQYDTTHVYVAPEDFNRFVKSFSDTFGGKTSPEGEFQVTPTPSKTMSQLVMTPVGTISVFGFKTPIPYPFGAERAGYLVTDMDAAIKGAKAHGADMLVAPFNDPIGRDAVVQWAGGVNMQLYWHTTKPNYAPLKTVPENRLYVSPERVDAFVRDFVAFSKGNVTSDDKSAPGVEIGRPGESYRRIRVESGFGKMVVHVTDGHLPYPYGRETTGYDVGDMAPALHKAIEAGAIGMDQDRRAGDRDAAIVQFPGGYIAELHASAR
jgi:hypothetical protein